MKWIKKIEIWFWVFIGQWLLNIRYQASTLRSHNFKWFSYEILEDGTIKFDVSELEAREHAYMQTYSKASTWVIFFGLFLLSIIVLVQDPTNKIIVFFTGMVLIIFGLLFSKST